MNILKFGGKSLANGQAIQSVIDIIKNKINNHEPIVIVISARGNATNELEQLLKKAQQGEDYTQDLEAFTTYQRHELPCEFYKDEMVSLSKTLEGVSLLGDYSLKIKDLVLSFGEIFSAKYIAFLLNKNHIKATAIDARKYIKTDDNFGNAQPINSLSQKNIVEFFSQNSNDVKIFTGFIGSTLNNETTTLGRNGSNFTASLLANYLNAKEFQNYTHVDGIFTADPDLVEDAKKIDQLSFNEANELANFGAKILHAKTIIPLVEKNISLRILNTFNPNNNGTLISSHQTNEEIKSLSVLTNVSLINFEGRGLLGRAGVDSRIFKVMAENNISVSIISQGSSERGIGLVVKTEHATQALIGLEKEFENDFYTKDVNKISINDNIAVISIIGQDLRTFQKPYTALIKNKITPILINNTVTGRNISLVVNQNDFKRALNVVHGEIFGVNKKINIAIFGHGTVGGTLINQIQISAKSIEEKKGIKLNIFAIANSKNVLLDKNGINENWQNLLSLSNHNSNVNDIIQFANDNHLENLIAIDNTASATFVDHYIRLAENGFDLISSNKIANTVDYAFYKKLRHTLAKNQKDYLYETNVGAGLPLIDTIKLLHLSGENITKIKGVFSGTLSYLFNTFSAESLPFSNVLKEAIARGYTEPDPREDLNGNDVGRKLLILARELDLENEFEDIQIENLIPQALQTGDVSTFLTQLDVFNPIYQTKKDNQSENHVLRYVGELSGDLQQSKGELSVKLVSVPANSALGSLRGSDSIFEIYTESYGNQPIIIQGAGAGAAVTARGVFGDILRLSNKKV